MKSIWKGSLSFGLVSIGIELYSAIERHSLGFKLLHSDCKTPIINKRWCSTCKKEVVWNDLVKGFKLSDGTYYIITPENLKKFKPFKSENINIVEFTNYENISPIYYDQHYYAMPSKINEKAFYLFVKALKDLNRCAIGQFVMKEKEYACSIMPYKTGMLLTTLNYDYELKELNKFQEIKAPKITPVELQLAKDLINKLTVDELNISQFKDNFALKLKKELSKASIGKKVKTVSEPKNIERSQVPLLDALRASLKLSNIPTTEKSTNYASDKRR